MNMMISYQELVRTFPKANEFKGDYNERKSKVNSLPGADSQAELEEKAAKTQKDFLDGKR